MTTTQRDLLNYVNEQAVKHETLRHRIYDAYDLFKMKIEDEHASVANEAALCAGEVMAMISEYKTNTAPVR